MIVRKLRLKKGWSQEQLAELTDLSVRTIQRAERGQKPSLETARSLASVFEVDISTFNRGINTMNPIDKYEQTDQANQESESQAYTQPQKEELKDDEKRAIEYVKGIKEFYTHLMMYIVFLIAVFIFKSNIETRMVLPFLGWGIGVIVHGLIAFEIIGLKWHKWEKRQIEKKLGRKL